MKINFIVLAVLSIFVVLSCHHDISNDDLNEKLAQAIQSKSVTKSLDYYIFPESDDYKNLPHQDPANPVTEAKVKLGNLLFFETGLAQSPEHDQCYETYSCSSCHLPTAGFMPGRVQGIADGGWGYGINGESRGLATDYGEHEIDAQGTRPMNPFNAGYSTVTLWSGLFGAGGPNEGTEDLWDGLADVNHTGYLGLEAQNIEAFDLHRLEINNKVLDDYGYRALYDAAFPEFTEEERYSPITSSFAISAFIRSFLANKAPFQDWLKGDQDAMTESQKKGALLFFGEAGCANCHNETALNSMTFHALGTSDLYEHGGFNTSALDVRNLGRGMFTGKEEDMRAFKVPQLYNLKDYTSYFHGSSKNSLNDVIKFKMNATSENPLVSNDQLSPFFQSRELSYQEQSALLDFIENALYDEDFMRYVPDEILSGNCFPNNDTGSQSDLGCN